MERERKHGKKLGLSLGMYLESFALREGRDQILKAFFGPKKTAYNQRSKRSLAELSTTDSKLFLILSFLPLLSS